MFHTDIVLDKYFIFASVSLSLLNRVSTGARTEIYAGRPRICCHTFSRQCLKSAFCQTFLLPKSFHNPVSFITHYSVLHYTLHSTHTCHQNITDIC